jgi:hypothetical protein
MAVSSSIDIPDPLTPNIRSGKRNLSDRGYENETTTAMYNSKACTTSMGANIIFFWEWEQPVFWGDNFLSNTLNCWY